MRRTLRNLTLILGLAQAWLAAGPPAPTPEWTVSPGAKAISALPRTAWLKDGTLLLCDTRRPEAERVLERLDPAPGARRPALDQAKAMAGLKELLGEAAPAGLPWPEEVDDLGRRALVKAGDALLVLDLQAATWRRLAGARAAALAPDGRRVALVRDHDLHILDLETGTEVRITRDGSETVLNGQFSWVYGEEIFDHREAACWWSPDSRSLAFLRSDESAVPLHSFTDFQPFQARVVAQRYPQAGQPNPRVTLGVASARAGTVAWMGLAPAAYEYLVRVTWLPASDRVAVQALNRAQDTLDLLLVDRATGAAAAILRERDADWVHFYDPWFLADGRQFLWASDRTGYNHLYRYDLDGRLVNAVTAGAWSLTPWGMYSGGRTGLVAVDEKAGRAYYTRHAGGGTASQLWRVGLDGSGAAPVSSAEGHHSVTFAPDRQTYLDAWSSLARPPSLTLARADGAPLRTLAEARTGLDLQLPGLLTIPAGDGFPLPARITWPRAVDKARRHPVIFSVYGGPGAPCVLDQWGGWDLLCQQLLVAEGYIVVAVDNRSSAAIGRKFEAAIRGRLYGDVELNDLADAVRWVKAQPWADPDRVGIWGWSGGGTYTLAALTRTREFKAGIAVAPVTDWRYYDSVYTELAMKSPADNPEGYLATSQVRTAKDLHGRLLLVHGSYDDNVHPQNSQAFIDALVQSGKLFEYMVYPMRQHSLSDDPARIHLLRTMVDFWKRNL